MTHDPTKLRAAWMELREREHLHGLEAARALGASECEVLASVCGVPGSPTATRLQADFAAFIALLPKLGHVKAITRNPDAVIEVEGTYGQIEFFGHMGQSVSSIDLRIFLSRWRHAFAVREETARGLSESIQFFDGEGRALHKLYLREQSDHAFFAELVATHRAENQTPGVVVEPPAAPAAPPAPSASDPVDVEAFRSAWRALQDTHEFHGLVRKFKLGRVQALELAGPELAAPVPSSALQTLLERVAKTDLPIMIFVGNPGIIQIHTGAIRHVVVQGPWVNILESGFSLHARTDHVTNAYVVRKPTKDGIVTSLELYSVDGEQIALLVGKRKPGQTESEPWRAAVESLLTS